MFKYYRITDKETVERIIGSKPTIKFLPASELNDPFELKFNLELNPNSSLSKKKYFENYPENKLTDFKSWQKTINASFIWHMEQKLRKSLNEIYSLACFSNKNDNNLMWSH